MSARGRSHRYAGPVEHVGPVELKAAVRPDSGGCRIGPAADFARWIAERSAVEPVEPFTFVVGADGALRPAPRRSGHVACAGGGMVLSAGEIGFVREAGWWTVSEVSNHSTGYWPFGFTHEVVFRRCLGCQGHNIVHEGDFVSVFCGSDQPAVRNVDPHRVTVLRSRPLDETASLMDRWM